jgi:hypothetical protein
MVKPNLIAHELGHAIFSYLYDKDSYPTSMVLKADGSTAACVNFDEYEDLPVANGNIARIPSNSYLGGMFGEFIWNGNCRVMGIRGDMDELLTELRYIKNGKRPGGKGGMHDSEHRYRRSKSKIFEELWAWFYTDRDQWSYGGMMKRWMDCPHNRSGTVMPLSRFRKRLPETAKIFDTFVSDIDISEFVQSVKDIRDSESTLLQSRTLRKLGRRIIPDTVLHPEDI